MSYDYAFKIVVVGDQGVGKTTLLDRIIHDKYDITQQMPTIGVEFQTKYIELEDKKIIKCQLWDTAGQEVFAPIIKTYFRGSAGALLCFALNEVDPIQRLNYWHKELKTHIPDYCKIILVGTKFDEGPACNIDTITDFAKNNNMECVFCSAITSYRCNEVLHTLAKKIYEDDDFETTKSKAGIKVMDLSISQEQQLADDMAKINCTQCIIH
jgi:small GTP-binding protein